MKKAVSVVALCLAFGAAGVTYGQQQQAPQEKAKPGEVGRRQVNQQRRIKQGARSGQLTRGETRRLERQQARIQRTKRRDRAMHGGKLTHREKAHLNRMQNRASRNIYRKKHNLRTKH